MKSKMYKTSIVCLLVCLLITGCEKTLSHFYPDKETPGVAIFSNTGNNVFSCFINGLPWQTISVTSGGLFSSGPYYEVYITRYTTNSLLDTLVISWDGGYSTNSSQNSNINEIDLVLPVTKNSGLKALSALQGKRITIDSTNGYFSANMYSLLRSANARGKGTVYFNIASFDSTALNGFQGRISGLLETDIGQYKITSGRFDDNINQSQVRFQ